METAPVVFLNFNRPDKTRASLANIRDAKPKELFVFADGPRDGNHQDQINCTEVRRILTHEINWSCRIWQYFPERNLGCGAGVSRAISLAFSYFEYAIIIEDDCIASKDFFSNTSRLLQVYLNDESIGAINGNNFQDGVVRGKGPYYLSKYFHCWGWATWKRVWRLYNFNIIFDEKNENKKAWIHGLFAEDERRYWTEVFNLMGSTNRLDIWDYQFTYLIFSNGLFCLTPNKNLVKNIGFGSDATHTKFLTPLLNLDTQDLPFDEGKLSLEPDLLADQYTFWKIFAQGSAEKRKTIMSGLIQIEQAQRNGNANEGLSACSSMKGVARLPGIDLQRAEFFIRKGLMADAIQSLREELRWFPSNKKAQELLLRHESKNFVTNIGDSEFRKLYETVAPYTMCSPERLHSLYKTSRLICETDECGDFVECGVAAGGSSLMIALVIKRYSKRPRKLFSFDTFEGMPPPSQYDKNLDGIPAQATHWGQGTCSSPVEYVKELMSTFEIEDIVQLHKGLFNTTLPVFRSRNPEIALLHIDGDWYDSTMDILNNLYSRMRPRAWVQVDDYGHWTGCKAAVDEFFAKNKIAVDLIDVDYTGRIFQIPDADARFRKNGYFVNIGCGATFVPGWKNFDIAPASDDVERFDIRTGIPVNNESAEVVYSSHFIEHLNKSDATSFLHECYRMLRPGGIIRIVFPDLEAITREYLIQLKLAEKEEMSHSVNHEWMIVEMIDQIARHSPGGEMIRFIAGVPSDNLLFIEQRVGSWVRNIPAVLRDQKFKETPESVGRFRLGGEVHQWMYDRVSMRRLLKQVGFTDIHVTGPESALIPNFKDFKLDSTDGKVPRKPDSCFMEASKPAIKDRSVLEIG